MVAPNPLNPCCQQAVNHEAIGVLFEDSDKHLERRGLYRCMVCGELLEWLGASPSRWKL